MRLLFVVMLFALLTSCSATGKVDCQGGFAYHSDDFTEEEQGWIKHGAERWNTWVGYEVVTVFPGDRGVCDIHSGTTNDPKAVGEEHSPTNSITIDLDHIKRINQLDQSHFESVVMHEMGHAMGYSHIGFKSGDALMSPSAGPDFTDLDRIQCIQLGMCKTLLPPNN